MALNTTIPATLPCVPLPAGALPLNDRGEVEFVIMTSKGPVTFRASDFFAWICRGSAEALSAAGYIDATWLPGLPGNCRIRQTVRFTKSGPQLRPAGLTKSWSVPPGPQLAIRKVPGRQYELIFRMPKSDEVRVFDALQSAHRKRADEESARWLSGATKDEIRSGLHACIIGPRQVFNELMASGSFRFDERTAKEIDVHFAAIHRLATQSTLHPKLERPARLTLVASR